MAAVAGADGDLFDELADLAGDGVEGDVARLQLGGEAPDALAVGGDDRRVESDDALGVELFAFAQDVVAVGLAGGERLADFAEIGCTLGDRGDEVVDCGVGDAQPALDGGALALALGLFAGDLAVIFRDQVRHGVGLEQLLGDAGDDAVLELTARDPHAVAAGRRLAVAGATIAAGGDHDISAAALSAADQSGQKVLRPALAHERAVCATFDLVLHRLPCCLVDDRELGHLDQDAIVGGIDARDAAARLGIAAHVDAVVEIAAGVDRVVEQAEAALARAGDRGGAPLAAARGGDAVGVERVGDRLGAAAGEILAINAADDIGLGFVDPAQTAVALALVVEPHDNLVAVAETAGQAAAVDRAALAAPDLVGEVLQEQRSHRALEADVQLVDAALGQRVDGDAGEFEALVNRGDVRLVARDAIERLGHDDVEAARGGVGKHSAHAGPPVRGAGHSVVGVDSGDRPAFAFGVCLAGADLVFGGVGGLAVGGEAGVDGAAGH